MNNPIQDSKCCQSFEPERIVENQIINSDTLYLYDGVNPRQTFFKNCLFTNIFIHNITACRFDSCIFHRVLVRKGRIYRVELHDCVFYNSSLIQSDVNDSLVINCSLIDVTLIDVWFTNSCFKDVTFNPKTQECFTTFNIIDMIDSNIWRSDQWVSIPGFCGIQDFFNI